MCFDPHFLHFHIAFGQGDQGAVHAATGDDVANLGFEGPIRHALVLRDIVVLRPRPLVKKRRTVTVVGCMDNIPEYYALLHAGR